MWLRSALRIVLPIVVADSQEFAQGLNPQLEDRSPAQLLREGALDDVGPMIVAAQRAFLVGG